MDVQDTGRKRLEQPHADDPHVAGEADQVHAMQPQLVDNRAIVRVAIRVAFRIEVHGVDARAPRPLEPFDAGAIRDHDGNQRVEPPIANGVDDRLQIGSAARDQNAEAPAHKYATVRCPATTEPMRRAAGSPAAFSAAIAWASSRAAHTTMRPMPMLKARNISSCAMPPRGCSSVKTARTCHARRASSALHPPG